MTWNRGGIRGALALLCALCLAAPPAPAAAATTLSEGHVDIYLAYEGGRWAPGVKTDNGTLPPNDVVLQVPVAARRPAPDSPAFAGCLGAAGTPVWLLPQVQTSGLLFLGYTTNVPPGTFSDNRVSLTLRSAEGPGEVCVYTTTAFGVPNIAFNTRDGIASADMVALEGQSHGHWNWSFSAPGTYRLGLEVSGATGAGPNSAMVGYTFEVVGDGAAATATPAAATPTPASLTPTPAPSATPAATSAAVTATPPPTDPTPAPTAAPPATPTPPAAAPTIRPTPPAQPPATSPSLPPGITIPVIPTLGTTVASPTGAPVGATPRGAGTNASPNPSAVGTTRTPTSAPTATATPVPAPSEQQDPGRALLLALGVTLVVALGGGAYLRLKGM